MTDKRYNLRGVSSQKDDVHNAIKNIDKGLFPKAFCKVVPDFLTGSETHCLVMHADGAGTKSHWLTPIGKRLEISRSGKVSPKML